MWGGSNTGEHRVVASFNRVGGVAIMHVDVFVFFNAVLVILGLELSLVCYLGSVLCGVLQLVEILFYEHGLLCHCLGL